MGTHGRILRYTTNGPRTTQIKIISQRKPGREAHKSDSDYGEGVTL